MRRTVSVLALLGASIPAAVAHANGLEVPDAGTTQVGRGSAWVAKADDPLAAYMNPAAMSFQASGVHVGAHLMIQDTCFARVDENGQPISPGNNIPGPGAPNGPDADTCTQAIFPNPQLAAVLRVTDAFAIGLAALGPHAVGNVEWPESIDYTLANQDRTQPSPTRYLLVSQQSLLIFPTLSLSYAVTPEFSIGAGFVWGIATADFTTFTESTSSSRKDDFTRDVKAHLTAADYFIPGFVFGINWRASRLVDVGFWYHFSDKISSRTDVELDSNYWLAGGTKNENSCAGNPDPECNHTVKEDAGSFELAIPMEAKLGTRFHFPLGSDARERPSWAKQSGYVRDGLSQDRVDVEADVTWAHNSQVDAVHIQFDPGIPVKGTPGEVPTNGDIPHNWRDVLGIRVGSDITVIPNLFGVRLGAFFESQAQDDEYLNLDFDMGWKVGASVGGVVRAGPADISLAYQYVSFGELNNGGNGAVHGLSGDASQGYRSQQAVNGGKLTSMLNEVALGVTFRFPGPAK
ncbi:MAG: outer membrane protein transport protein [Polyangiaceae bacterium]